MLSVGKAKATEMAKIDVKAKSAKRILAESFESNCPARWVSICLVLP